jgi:ABC-type transport system involved in Fe-S cluster assembly fused permease/ATPase subunit
MTRGIYTDCLLNYETVKYFCGEEHESVRFRKALRDYQGSEYNFLRNCLSFVRRLSG